MNDFLTALVDRLRGPQQALASFWEQREPRERLILSVGILAVMLALLYLLLIEPALNGRAQLEKNLPVLRQQAASFQAQAREAASLAGKGMPNVPATTNARLEASLTGRGLRAQNISVTPDLIRLQLSSASFAELLAWLNEMQKSSRLSVVESNVVAQEAIDTVNATLTLRQQKAEP